MPESFFDTEKGEVKGDDLRKHIDELATFKAADDSRRASLPQTPEAYQLALPETFQAPEGIDVKIDANDPMYAQARALAHAKGWTQQDFSEALGLVATMKADEAARYEALKTANLAALGAKGPERIDALVPWIMAEAGDADAKPIIATLATAAHVRFFEKILTKITNQGAAPFKQGGREVDTGKVDQATYDAMSFSQKKAYAEKHQGRAA